MDSKKPAKALPIQDPYLNALRKERISVSVYLVNGVKLQGKVDSFDQFVVLLRSSVTQMVYKHAISTIVPMRDPKPYESSAEDRENAEAES